MFINYSQTYAATITTIAGFLALVLGKYGIGQPDIEFAIGTAVAFIGLAWQIYHRFSKGDVSVVGVRQ